LMNRIQTLPEKVINQIALILFPSPLAGEGRVRGVVVVGVFS